MTMKILIDESLWHEAWLDTPFAAPSAYSAEAAMRLPGCHVKSKERNGQWPKFFGILVTYDVDTDRVVVRSKNLPPMTELFPDTNGKAIWVGTLADYHATWDCD
jgi:hypothetical protein